MAHRDTTDNLGTLTTAITDKLFKDDGFLTSDTTEFEGLFGEAVSGIEEAQIATQKSITAKFTRLREEEIEGAERTITGAIEGQRGFATQSTLLRNIKDDTEKDLRQLDLLEQEALGFGRTQAAAQIAALKMQRIQFLQDAKQQIFSNLLALGSFGLSIQQEKRLTAAQEQQERQAMAQIALDFGVEVGEHDTFDDVVNKAIPNASAEQKLRLEAMRTEVALNRARITEIGETTGNQALVDFYAELAESDPSIVLKLPQALQNEVARKVAQNRAPRKFEDDELRDFLRNAETSEGVPFSELSSSERAREIETTTIIENKDRAKLISEELFGKKKRGVFFDREEKKTTPGGTARQIRQAAAEKRKVETQKSDAERVRSLFVKGDALTTEERNFLRREIGLIGVPANPFLSLSERRRIAESLGVSSSVIR